MLSLLILVINSIICLAILILFFYYYGIKPKFNISFILNIAIFIFSYIPLLMGVAILSYELSQYFDTTGNLEKTETPALLNVQKTLYYLTQILSFLVNPIIMEYKKVTEQEELREKTQRRSDSELELENPESRSTCCSKFKTALCNQLKYYIILLIVITIALFFVVYFNIDILSFKEYIVYLPAITNIYGLFLFSVTIGSGLSQIPLSIWRKSNPINSIRYHFIQLSETGSRDKPNYNYLINQTKSEYIRLKKLIFDDSKAEKARKYFIRFLSLFSALISLGYLGIEISYSLGYSGFSYFLNYVNNERLNQIILFLFIGFVTMIGGYVLTCLNPGSMVNGCCGCCKCCDCRSFLLKCFDILRYKFEAKNTESSTFGFWSTYLQRLVPTIAYHCQQMAGQNESSLEQIIGKLDQFHIYTVVVKSVLPLLLSFIMAIAMCCGDSALERERIRRGIDVFRRRFLNAEINMWGIDDDQAFRIEQLIVDDNELTEEESEMYRNKRNCGKKKRNDLEVPLNSKLNNYHQQSPEPPNFNDDDL